MSSDTPASEPVPQMIVPPGVPTQRSIEMMRRLGAQAHGSRAATAEEIAATTWRLRIYQDTDGWMVEGNNGYVLCWWGPMATQQDAAAQRRWLEALRG